MSENHPLFDFEKINDLEVGGLMEYPLKEIEEVFVLDVNGLKTNSMSNCTCQCGAGDLKCGGGGKGSDT